MRDHPQSMRKSLRLSKDTQATRSAPTTPVVDSTVRRNSQGQSYIMKRHLVYYKNNKQVN